MATVFSFLLLGEFSICSYNLGLMVLWWQLILLFFKFIVKSLSINFKGLKEIWFSGEKLVMMKIKSTCKYLVIFGDIIKSWKIANCSGNVSWLLCHITVSLYFYIAVGGFTVGCNGINVLIIFLLSSHILPILQYCHVKLELKVCKLHFLSPSFSLFCQCFWKWLRWLSYS